MAKYETMLVTSSALDEEASAALIGKFKSLIEATQKANPGIWGKRDLLYKREPFGYRVYINNGNFAASSGNQDDAEEAFKKIDLVVVNNRLIHWTASAFVIVVSAESSTEHARWNES